MTETNNGKQNLTRRNSSLGAELNAKQEMILSIQRKYREEKVSVANKKIYYDLLKATLESKIHLLTQEQHTLEVKLRESNRQVQETKQQLHRLQVLNS